MNKSKKLRVAVIFGGKSAEHEVSLQSARNIINALDGKKYEPVLIGIDKEGVWHLSDARHYLLNGDNPKLIALNKTAKHVGFHPGAQENQLVSVDAKNKIGRIDVIFPVLHGPYGEDGSIQGLFKLANIPFVGPGVLGSAIGMDKDVMKRLFRDAGIPTSDFLAFGSHQKKEITFDAVVRRLGLPLFVKPANLGSSVGISKVKNKAEFKKAVDLAFKYDRKIIIEENIPGREIECSVLGNEKPVASVPGEVVSNADSHDFYSYEAKYIDEKGAALVIPAKLPKKTVKAVQDIAVKAFQVLCLEGMARVDMFLTPEGKLVVNEVNTIPGFTAISMYPKLWEASGKSNRRIISELIELAIWRFKQEEKLKTTVD